MQNFAEIIREIISNLVKLLRNASFQLPFKFLTEVVKVSKSENILFLPRVKYYLFLHMFRAKPSTY
jgi:hypothetical protein